MNTNKYFITLIIFSIVIANVNCIQLFKVDNYNFSGIAEFESGALPIDFGPIPGNAIGRMYVSGTCKIINSNNCQSVAVMVPSMNTVCPDNVICMLPRIMNYAVIESEPIDSDGVNHFGSYMDCDGKYHRNMIIADIDFGDLNYFNMSFSHCYQFSKFSYTMDIKIKYAHKF